MKYLTIIGLAIGVILMIVADLLLKSFFLYELLYIILTHFGQVPFEFKESMIMYVCAEFLISFRFNYGKSIPVDNSK